MAAGNEGVSDNVQYAHKRLVRGLGSSREGARQGFSMALGELLAHFPLGLGPTLALMRDSLTVTSAAKGQEVRDAYYGFAFGYAACVRSGSVAREVEAQPGLVLGMAKHLLELAASKAYLQALCCDVLAQLINALAPSGFRSAMLPMLIALARGAAGPTGLAADDVAAAAASGGSGDFWGTAHAVPEGICWEAQPDFVLALVSASCVQLQAIGKLPPGLAFLYANGHPLTSNVATVLVPALRDVRWLGVGFWIAARGGEDVMVVLALV